MSFPCLLWPELEEEGYSEDRALCCPGKVSALQMLFHRTHSTGSAVFTAGSTCLSASEMGAWAAPRLHLPAALTSGLGPCRSHHPGAHATLRSFTAPHLLLVTFSTNSDFRITSRILLACFIPSESLGVELQCSESLCTFISGSICPWKFNRSMSYTALVVRDFR